MSLSATPAPAYEEIGDERRLPRSPRVSVLMLVHDHAPYLAQAIEGVLAQDCDFPFELLIGEDASGDGSLDIARHYQRRHPELIRLVHWQQNVGMNGNQRALFRLARGEFLAYCEGDDYWCHPGKLAAQLALLQADPDAGCVHADWVRAKPGRDGFHIDWRHSVHARVQPELLQGDLFHAFHFPKILRTCTLMQRRSAVEAFHASALAGPDYLFVDTVRSSYITSRWRVLYWPQIAAVYRESRGSALRSGAAAFQRFLHSSLAFDSAARQFFASRDDYPQAYRWECSVGILLRALRDGEFHRVIETCRDLRRHYRSSGFLRAAATALLLRWPTWQAQRRSLPDTRESAARQPATGRRGARRWLARFIPGRSDGDGSAEASALQPVSAIE